DRHSTRRWATFRVLLSSECSSAWKGADRRRGKVHAVGCGCCPQGKDGERAETARAIAQFTNCCIWRFRSYSSRAALTLGRSDTSGTATSHQCPPASVETSGSVSMTITLVLVSASASFSA